MVTPTRDPSSCRPLPRITAPNELFSASPICGAEPPPRQHSQDGPILQVQGSGAPPLTMVRHTGTRVLLT